MDKFWEQNAEAWFKVIDTEGIPSRRVTNKAILEQIFALSPKSVLDLGCGEGFMSVPLRAGGIRYHGLDGSKELVKLAKQKHGEFFEAISYEELPNWKPKQKFDVVLFNFSLFEEDLQATLKAAIGFLNPHGRVLVQTLHSCFAMGDYRSGWNTEDFKTMSVPFSGTMRWYGRTLSDWQNLFTDSGVRVAKLSEPIYEEKPASLIFELLPI